MAQKPWRSLGESNPSFQIEKRALDVETKELSRKTRPFKATEFRACPEHLLNAGNALCPICGGSGCTLKSGHPFKTRNCWMCAGRLYFGPRFHDEGLEPRSRAGWA